MADSSPHTVQDDFETLRDLVEFENRAPYTDALLRVEKMYTELADAARWFASDGNRTVANDPAWKRLRKALDG